MFVRRTASKMRVGDDKVSGQERAKVAMLMLGMAGGDR